MGIFNVTWSKSCMRININFFLDIIVSIYFNYSSFNKLYNDLYVRIEDR